MWGGASLSWSEDMVFGDEYKLVKIKRLYFQVLWVLWKDVSCYIEYNLHKASLACQTKSWINFFWLHREQIGEFTSFFKYRGRTVGSNLCLTETIRDMYHLYSLKRYQKLSECLFEYWGLCSTYLGIWASHYCSQDKRVHIFTLHFNTHFQTGALQWQRFFFYTS